MPEGHQDEHRDPRVAARDRVRLREAGDGVREEVIGAVTFRDPQRRRERNGLSPGCP
jgi:hypothetical protein